MKTSCCCGSCSLDPTKAAVTHQAAEIGKHPAWINRGHHMAGCQLNKLFASNDEKRVWQYDESAQLMLDHHRESRFKFICGTSSQNFQTLLESVGCRSNVRRILSLVGLWLRIGAPSRSQVSSARSGSPSSRLTRSWLASDLHGVPRHQTLAQARKALQPWPISGAKQTKEALSDRVQGHDARVALHRYHYRGPR